MAFYLVLSGGDIAAACFFAGFGYAVYKILQLFD